MLVAMIILFAVVYQRRALQQEMVVKQIEFDHQQNMLRATLISQEVERNRIAKDLHDSVGAMLSTLQLVIKQYGRKPPEETRQQKMLASSTSIIDDTIATVRRISHDLLPPNLQRLGLQMALQELLETVGQASAIAIDFKMAVPEKLLSSEEEITIYRMVLEFVNNSIKHAEASMLKVALNYQAGVLRLMCLDNGKGMEQTSAEMSGGLGLRNIESRALFLGGKVVWETAPGNGLKASIEFKPTNT